MEPECYLYIYIYICFPKQTNFLERKNDNVISSEDVLFYHLLYGWKFELPP
jgi:hypothetical protein